MVKPLYKRILLKLSGEALMGPQQFGIHPETCHNIASGVKAAHDAGIEIGIIIGAGNIFRGVNSSSLKMNRVVGDHVGMIATSINGIVLQQTLASLGCDAHIMSALGKTEIVEAYSWQKALSYLSNKKPVIFVGGTGHPYFTTDTAAALRATEIQAEVVLKATKVDGIYDKDPVKYPDAKKYDTLTFSRVIKEKLRIMDITAITICMENGIPIRVFDINSIEKAVFEENFGTLVKEG